MGDENKRNLAKLLKKAQAGDSASLQLLCKELERYIRGYFWEKFQNNSIVDDLSQETYLRFLRNLLLIQDEMKLKSFIAKVALHVTQDYFKKKSRIREEYLETFYRGEIRHNRKLKSEMKGEILDYQNDSNIVRKIDLERALNQIPEIARKILIMKTQGYKYEEISAEVGLTVSGVKMQIKRGLEQLKFLLFL